MKSLGVVGGETEDAFHQAHFSPRHAAFLDVGALYFELERFKAERGWFNLNLTRQGIRALLADNTWYCLRIPEEELAFDSIDKVRRWQEIALALLRKHTERYYTFRNREWELPHLEYRDLTEDDPNFFVVREEGPEYGYRILIEESQQEIVQKPKELKSAIEAGDLRPWEFRGIKAVWFGPHLYRPLLFLEGAAVEISPAPLNKGERRFVEDLKTFHDGAPEFFADKELYLLRNLSRGRGVGFFDAGSFHPDFILWLVVANRQRVVFVDPKGIRQVGVDNSKVRFYKTVKEIEKRLGDANVTLDSFLISNTPSHQMRKLWGIDKAAMVKRNILFQQEDKGSNIRTMLQGIGESPTQ